MQKINKIIQPFPKILVFCYFGGSACPGMPDQTQHILHDLIKTSMDIMNIIPQIVFEKLNAI